ACAERRHPGDRLPGRAAGAGAVRPRHPARRPRHANRRASAARAAPARLLCGRVGRARRAAVVARAVVGRLRALCLAEGLQGRRPVPLSRRGEGQARLSALFAADLAADRAPAGGAARPRAGAPHSGAVRSGAERVRAMVLAAGFGSRLRPLTDHTPKPLLKVGDHPLIAYPLALLRAAGIDEVIINLHHRGDQLRAAVGDGAAYGLSIRYSEEAPILDTGGAIKKAQPFLQRDRFVVLNSDAVCDVDLRAVIDWHSARGALATMVLRADPDAARYGLIEIDATARIRRFLGVPATVEQPLTPLMFTGVHVF